MLFNFGFIGLQILLESSFSKFKDIIFNLLLDFFFQKHQF